MKLHENTFASVPPNFESLPVHSYHGGYKGLLRVPPSLAILSINHAIFICLPLIVKGYCPCHWKIRMNGHTAAPRSQSQMLRETKPSSKMDVLEPSGTKRGGSGHGSMIASASSRGLCV